MTSKRRIEITIETRSLTIIRTNGKTVSADCQCCRETVTAFAPQQIAAFLRLDLTEVCRRIEEGKLHLTDSRRAVALICGNSLKDNKD